MILRLNGRANKLRFVHTSGRTSNHYAVLGINVGATKKEVKSAYRDKVKTCHPDLFPDDKKKESEFRRIQEAYESIISGTGHESAKTNNHSGPRPGTEGFRTNVGYDFEHNFRARMRARAEWEKMAKQWKDAERKKYQDANRHHAKWDHGNYKNKDDIEWFKETTGRFRSGPNAGQSDSEPKYEKSKFQSKESYQRYQAWRVQQNLHKSDSFRTEFSEEDLEKIKQESFKRRRKYYEAAEQQEKEWRQVAEQRQQRRNLYNIASVFFIGTICYMLIRAKSRWEEELLVKQAYSNESIIKFQEMTRQRLLENATRNQNQTPMSDANRVILETLEYNSEVLKNRRGPPGLS